MPCVLRWRLVQIHCTRLGPFRITGPRPLLATGCSWARRLRWRGEGSGWDGRSPVRSGSATPGEDEVVLFASRKTVNSWFLDL